jgi:spermidine/putrescine transport system substrate-binding protein
MQHEQAVETCKTCAEPAPVPVRTSGLVGLGRAGLGPSFLDRVRWRLDSDSAVRVTVARRKQDSKNLYFANWPAYIDEEAPTTVDRLRSRPLASTFKYTTEYNDNNEYFAKIQPLLSKGRQRNRSRPARSDVLDGGPPDLSSAGWTRCRWTRSRTRRTCGSSLQKPAVGSRPASTRCRGSRGSRASRTTSEVTGRAAAPRSTTCGTRQIQGQDRRAVRDARHAGAGRQVARASTSKSRRRQIACRRTIVGADQEAGGFSGQVQASSRATTTWTTWAQGNFAACIGWSGDIAQLSKGQPRALKFVIPESAAARCGPTRWSFPRGHPMPARRPSGWTSCTTR